MTRKWAVSASDLTKEQIDAIELPIDNCYAITGPAGSGKTNVLLLRAKYILRTRPNTTLQCVVFTSALKEFIRKGMAEYEVDERYVNTLYGWSTGITHDKKAKANKSLDFDERQRESIKKILSLIESGKMNRLDYLLVDEAHDLDKETIEMFFRVAVNVNLFFDTNQSIYELNSITAEDLLPRSFAGVKSKLTKIATLGMNFRVPWKIAELATRILPDSKLTECTDEKESLGPNYNQFNDETQECVFITRKVTDLQQENPDYNFVILEKTNRDNLVRKYEKLRASGLDLETQAYAVRNLPDYSSDLPKLITYHSAKGLEFDIVFVSGASPAAFSDSQYDRNLAYVAVTRARKALFITGAPGISRIFHPKVDETPRKVTIEELF